MKIDYSKYMGELFDLLVIGDQSIYSRPIADPKIIDKLAEGFSVPKSQLRENAVEDLYIIFGVLLARQFMSWFVQRGKRRDVILHGLNLLFWKVITEQRVDQTTVILAANKKRKAYNAFYDFLAQSGITPIPDRKKYLAWYIQNFNIPFSGPADQQTENAIFRELSTDDEIGDLSIDEVPIKDSERRTADKHIVSALKDLGLAVHRVVPEVFRSPENNVHPLSETNVQPIPDTTIRPLPEIRENSVDVVLESIRQLMCECSSYTTNEDFGFRWPIDICGVRTVQIGADTFDSLSKDLLSVMGASLGIITGSHYSGISTLAMILTNRASRIEFLDTVFCYVDARQYLPYARNRRSIFEYFLDLLRKTGKWDRGDHNTVNHLQAIDKKGKFVFIVDNLRKLPAIDQIDVIGQFVLSPHVYFCASPALAGFVREQFGRFNPSGDLLDAVLLDLTKMEGQQILFRYFNHIGQPQRYDLACTHFNRARKLTDIYRSPLGVLALATLCDKTVSDFRIVITMINELLRKEGQEPCRLKPTNAIGGQFERFGGWLCESFRGQRRIQMGDRSLLYWDYSAEIHKNYDRNGFLPLLESPLFYHKRDSYLWISIPAYNDFARVLMAIYVFESDLHPAFRDPFLASDIEAYRSEIKEYVDSIG